MGVKHALRRQCLPKKCGLLKWSINITKGKHHHIHNDPYAEGERLGKHVKPNVVSAKVNANVCTHAPSSTFVAAPLMSRSTS